MAKRKAPSKSSPAAAAAAAAAASEAEAARQQQPQEEEKKAPETQQQEEEPTKVTVKVEDLEEEDQVNEEEVEEEEEEEAEEEEEDENASAEANNDDDEDEDDDSVQKLLEPFTKDQLIELLREAADKHGDVLENIRKLSDIDPVHRKVFVHGLGWDSNSEILIDVFKKYGDIEDCKAVVDKLTGKSKGYAFILFKSRIGAKKALKEPQKKIGSRMTSCQLASAGPVPTQSNVQTASALMNASVSEYTQRKIYVSNVAAEIDPQKLVSFFSKFGEIEEGPLGLDKDTGKPRGFALFVYKSIESARKALEEPHKTFEGHVLHCQKAIDGPKPNKQQYNQFQQQQAPSGARPSKFARTDNNSFGGSHSGVTGGHLMAQSGPGVPYNQGASQALNPVLGQALTALLASQGGGGLGLNNILGTFGSTGVGAAGNPAGAPLLNSAMQGGYGNQHMGSGYGSQPGMQGGYSNYQMGGAGRSHKGGYTGGANPYMGR